MEDAISLLLRSCYFTSPATSRFSAAVGDRLTPSPEGESLLDQYPLPMQRGKLRTRLKSLESGLKELELGGPLFESPEPVQTSHVVAVVCDSFISGEMKVELKESQEASSPASLALRVDRGMAFDGQMGLRADCRPGWLPTPVVLGDKTLPFLQFLTIRLHAAQP